MASIYRKKSGDIWYYSITYRGRRYQGTTKTTDKKSAQLIAESIQTDLAREIHSLPALNKTVVNFTTVWEEYLKHQNNSKGTIDKKKWHAKHFLPVFGNKNITDISSIDIKNYQLLRKQELQDEPKNAGKKDSQITFAFINGEIMTLSNFFNFCIERNYIDKNPAFKIKKLNELSRIKTLSDEDIQKLISAATNKLTRDIITFLIYTGCRKGEALNLKWDDVDMKNGIIAIKGTKTKYDRYIPISEALRGVLGGIEKKDDCFSRQQIQYLSNIQVYYTRLTQNFERSRENRYRCPTKTATGVRRSPLHALNTLVNLNIYSFPVLLIEDILRTVGTGVELLSRLN